VAGGSCCSAIVCSGKAFPGLRAFEADAIGRATQAAPGAVTMAEAYGTNRSAPVLRSGARLPLDIEPAFNAN